ncbi:peroxide stress protein YaaA [Clostridium sp. Marseille-QA1073]
MITIISPAKSLNFDSTLMLEKSTEPKFLVQCNELIDKLKTMNSYEIMKLMKVSKNIADLNIERFNKFKESNKAKQAIFAYNGQVYKSMNPINFSEEEIEFAQNHLRIMSGLYGILKPLDLIKEYRLEMSTKLKNSYGDNLYKFWGEKITAVLEEEIKGHNEKAIVNLASEEYSKSIDLKKLSEECKILNIVFKENRNGEYKVIGMKAKAARGLMVSYIIKNHIDKVEEIKDFDIDGYSFNSKLSNKDTWIFTR